MKLPALTIGDLIMGVDVQTAHSILDALRGYEKDLDAIRAKAYAAGQADDISRARSYPGSGDMGG